MVGVSGPRREKPRKHWLGQGARIEAKTTLRQGGVDEEEVRKAWK